MQLALAYPPVTGYQYRAFPLSIISSYEMCWPWILENFIQLRCSQRFEEPQRVLDFTDPTLFTFPTPWFDIQRIERVLFDRYLGDFKQFTIDCIQSQHYVYLYVDEYFVPNRAPFQEAHILHDLLIYGYDDSQSEFHIAGFDAQGFYRQTTLSYQQFQQATSMERWTTEPHNPLLLVRFQADAGHELNIARMRETLNHYYQGTPCPGQAAWNTLAPDSAYGLDVYDALGLYIQRGAERQFELETRPFQLLIEHKQLMVRRLNYLRTSGMLNCDEQYEQAYTELAKSLLSVRNGILKYLLSDQARLLVKAQKQLQEIQTKERDCLQKIITLFSR